MLLCPFKQSIIALPPFSIPPDTIEGIERMLKRSIGGTVAIKQFFVCSPFIPDWSMIK
jgi:hypothetical protein